MLDLLHPFRSTEIHVVGTIRLNRLRSYPLDTNKDLMKNGRGTMDYCCDCNSGIMAVKWIDNSVVNLASTLVGVEPIGKLERWCGMEKVRKNIPCPQIVQQYNKSMGVVDLADMLLLLYQTPCKTITKRYWYQKIFWYLIDMAKISAIITFVRIENHIRIRNLELSDALILANKVNPYSSKGRPPTRRSLEALTTGKKATQALPVTDVRFDQIAYWPSPSTNKN